MTRSVTYPIVISLSHPPPLLLCAFPTFLYCRANGFAVAKMNGTLSVVVGTLPIELAYRQADVHLFLGNSSEAPIKPVPPLRGIPHA